MAMRHKDADHDELGGVVRRLRAERPQADPLMLDRIKTSVLARAKAARGHAVARQRLVVAGLTAGLIAAGTGGVIAAGGAGHASGNAATAQYGDAGGGVLGYKHHKTPIVHYHLRIHAPSNTKLETVTIVVNGKTVTVLKGEKAAANVDVDLHCSKKATTVAVIAVTSTGKTITQSHHLRNACKT